MTTLQIEKIENLHYVYWRNEKTFQNISIYQDSAGLTPISQGTSENAVKHVAKGYSYSHARKLYRQLTQENKV